MTRSTMRRSSALGAALAALAGAAPAAGQYFATPPAAEAATPPTIAKSGAVTINPATEAKMRQQVKAPEGFDLTLFAGPPVAMYPICVAEGADGAIYVCVDPNSSLSRIKNVGRVMRLVDENNDGKADRYTVFAEMDSPRGAVFDGETLYVMHPPNLTAYRDTNGDGISDWSKELVTGLGFDLDFRGADHTTNQVQMGVDGWLYVAVGDYGFVRAVGADGTQISHRGGAVVRVRPDGTNLEVYATGTRNIVDVAIDPFNHVFARDNTNDGDGWNTRLHYTPAGAFMGYPTQYLNFASEHFPSLFDYGSGSGVGSIWIQDPAWPEPFRNALLTGDWTVNKIVRNPLTPKGSSYEVQQADFIGMVRPTDLVMDARSSLFVSSLSGGQFRYVADTIGYIFRVTPSGVATAAPQVRSLNDAQLAALLASANAVHRQHAQHEILRRNQPAAAAALERLILDAQQPAHGRAAAMFTLKQLVGERANAVLVQAAAAPDARVREVALRALADRKDQLAGVTPAVFVRALADPDDHVKVQALNGLVRLGAVESADAIVPLAASADQGMSHLAVRALVDLGAREAALRAVDGGSAANRAGALRALAQMHDGSTVSALLDRLPRAQGPEARRALLETLARLYNQEGAWRGDWWTTRPSFIGPYYDPAPWSESPRIRAVLERELLSATGAEAKTLADALVLNRVLPQGSQALILALGTARDPQRPELVRAMLGRSIVGADQVPVLMAMDAKSPALHAAVVELVAKQPTQSASTTPLLRAAALDASLAPAVREQVLNGLASVPGTEGTMVAAPIFARLNPAGGGEDTPVDAAWRRWVGNNRRGQELDYFIGLTRGTDSGQRVLGYAVLLQRLRGNNVQPAVRQQVTPVIDGAWASPATAADIAKAVRIMRLEAEYSARLQSVGTR